MDVELLCRPGASIAKIGLGAGESITCEAGCMMAMSQNITIETTTHKRNQGSILRGIKRLFAGESFFLNYFTAIKEPGELILGTDLLGDMLVHELKGLNLIVQAGSFVACEKGVDVAVGWQGLKSLFSGEALFWLKMSGAGKVILNSYGAIFPVNVDNEFIVDTGHIVAFEESLNFSISKAGSSWLHSFIGGEGFVCKFSGRGTVWVQTHNFSAFAKSIGSSLRPRT